MRAAKQYQRLGQRLANVAGDLGHHFGKIGGA